MAKSARFEALVNEAKGRVQEVTAAEAAKLQTQNAIVIDVREKEEFEKGHAPGAIHLSKGVLELKVEERVPDSQTTVVLYCGGGSRSALAAESLQRMGYTKVMSLSGGFKAWQQEGLPVES